MSAPARIEALAQAHPEWAPWLGVLRELVPELSRPAWDQEPPRGTRAPGAAPWLAQAELRPDARALAVLWDRLRGVALAQGLRAMAGEGRAVLPASDDEAAAVFLAAVNDDTAALEQQALQAGASPEGWRTLARLLPMPYLHGCARGWSAQARPGGSQGCCPVCGEWPAFAEVRGVERARHLRCGRCGAGWPMPVLACTYCGTRDHEQLGTLVAEDRKAAVAVETCRCCSGYLKSFTLLQATPSEDVLAVDLESVAFDLVALERGFQRPAGPGVALGATLALSSAPAPVPPRRRWWW